MSPLTRRGPGRDPGARSNRPAQDDPPQRTSTLAEREIAVRVESMSVVLDAVRGGVWPRSAEILDAIAANLGVAARWALVAELERAA
jgi:hypothetical protein